MVRVYSQPGQLGLSTLGGVYGSNSYKPICMRLPQTPSQFDYNPGHGHGPALYLPTPEPDVRVVPGDHHEEVQPPPHHHPHYHQPPQQMRLPVTVGICKLCKRVYRPEPAEGGGVLCRTGGGGGGVDYEELLNQKRRDEARYRHGNDPYNDYARSGQLKSSTSDGFLNRVAPSYNSQGINQEMEDLSRALSRLQNSVAPENEDVQQSFSYPTSAINGSQDYGSRKTWSAPNKDPFGGGGGLDDPFQRRSGYGGSHHNNSNIGVGGYQPSFGGDGRQRGRGRQNIDELAGQMKQSDRHQKNAYLHELAEQVEEQKRRRAKEQADASTDWWEKKKPPVEAEYKSPHPNQDHPSIYGNNASQRKTRNKNNDPSSYDRPDPAEARRRYELELKEQMEAKKKHDDEVKRKEREEEEKLERRLQEQQEKMKREFEEEQNKKKEKEKAKLKRQEELAKRQVKLQQEMDQKKREEDLRKQMERRGPSRHSSRGHRRDRGQDGDGAQPQQSPNFRTDSPPIPTLRGQPPPPSETETRVDETGTRPVSPGVVDQLQNMRQSLERRRESLQYEDEKLGETWNGLAEL